MSDPQNSEWLDDGELEAALQEAFPGSPDPRAPIPGRRVTSAGPRYAILEELARGGMGVVWRGHDEDLDRDVAIKVLREDLADDSTMRSRFFREATLGGQLQHPGIVPVYDVGQHADQRPFLTMRLVDGRNLAELLHDPAISRERLLAVLEQVCQAVGYAHARGIVHRDLKPLNVMVGEFGEVVVVDWGLAKAVDPGVAAGEAGSSPAPARGESAAGSVVGTPGYMAPEQARGEPADARSDVFALGSVLCEILTGEPAFPGADTAEIRARTASGDLDECHRRLQASSADAELVALGVACLQCDPTGRPASGREVAATIDAHRHELAERAEAEKLARASAESRADAERRASRVRTAAAGVVTLLILAGALGGSALDRARRDELERRVAALRDVLEVASRRYGEAEATTPPDPAAFDRAADSIAPAILLCREAGIPRPLVERVERLRADLDARTSVVRAEQRRTADNRRLLAQLDACVYDVSDDSDEQRQRQRTEALFDELNLHPFEAADESVLAELRARGIDRELAGGLSAWSGLYGPESERRRRLLELAKRLDPDPWRVRLRDALLARNRPALHALLAEPALLDQPSDTIASAVDDYMAGGMHEEYQGNTVSEAVNADLPLVERVLRMALARDRRHYGLNLALAQLLAIFSRPARASEALEHAHTAAAMREDHVGTMFVMAGIYGYANRYRESVFWTRRVIEARPDHARARFNLGWLLSELGETDEARAELERFVEDRPRDASGWLTLGHVRSRLGLQEDAASAFERTVEIRGHWRDRAQYSLALMDLGRYEPALEVLAEARRQAPNSGVVAMDQTRALVSLGRYEEAVETGKRAVELEETADSRYWLGRALRATGGEDAALESYSRGEALDPSAVGPAYESGRIYRDRGHLTASLAAFERATRAANSNESLASSLSETALVLLRGGRPSAAAARYRRALELDPLRVNARTNLASSYERVGNRDRAERTGREAADQILRGQVEIGSSPVRLDALANLANRLVETGQLEEAIRMARAACERGARPRDRRVLAYALLEAGRLAEAEEVLGQAVSLPDSDLGRRETNTDLELVRRMRALLPRREVWRDPAVEASSADDAHARAHLCRNEGEWSTAARWWQRALQLDPKPLADASRGWAEEAIRAALAASREAAADAGSWRTQAQDWLTERLDHLEEAIGAPPPPRELFAPAPEDRLLVLRYHPGYSPLDDPAWFARLPSAEQAEWQRLRQREGDLLRRLYAVRWAAGPSVEVDVTPPMPERQAQETPSEVATTEIGQTMLRSGQPARAAKILQDVIRTPAGKGDAAAWRLLATAYGQLRKLDDALLATREAIDLAPNDAAAHLEFARAHRRLGHFSDAIDQYDLAVSLGIPEPLVAFPELWLVLTVSGGLDEVMSHQLELVKRFPNDPAVQITTGQAFLMLVGDAEQALEYLEQTVRLDDSIFVGFAFQGYASARLARYGEAAAFLEEARRRAPGQPEYLAAHAAHYRRLDALVTTFELGVIPEHADGTRLADLMVLHAHIDELEAAARAAVQLAEVDSELFAANRLDAVFVTMRRALELDDRDPAAASALRRRALPWAREFLRGQRRELLPGDGPPRFAAAMSLCQLLTHHAFAPVRDGASGTSRDPAWPAFWADARALRDEMLTR